ncbi:MAG: saccharopine dehydrogenase NADP-binding domain-containing protein [Clostridiales bacterium]|nr:saccharopine dehydrogenase NADP-binding domain-containing protein [Clostridiales bacterium]
MNKILIIGLTDATRVIVPYLCTHKGLVDEICIAAKNKDKCDELKKKYKDAPVRIVTAGVDVTIEEKALLMMRIFGPNVIINVAPSHLNKLIMGIAVKIGASYIDEKYYTDETGRTCLIEEQFAMASGFFSNKTTCVTGCSFSAAAFLCLTRLALSKKMLDSVSSVDIIDLTLSCSNKDEAMPTKEDFFRLSQPAKYIEGGEVKEAPSLSISSEFAMNGDPVKVYMFSSPVIDCYQRGLPEIKEVKYYADLEQSTADIAGILRKIGMLSSEPIKYKGIEIAPIDYLSEVLPKPVNSDDNKGGKNIKGVLLTGTKGEEEKSIFMYFECSSSEEPSKYGVDVSSYLSAVTLMSGALLISSGEWNTPGVFTSGDFDPELLLAKMEELGIKYSIGYDVKRPYLKNGKGRKKA